MDPKPQLKLEKGLSKRHRLIDSAAVGLELGSSARNRPVSEALELWFAQHGRTFLWRRTAVPYEVLIAEILLRKTVASVVDRSLTQVLARYPSSISLAQAQLDDLVALLAPLGLVNQRAEQLHRLGHCLEIEFVGRIPRSVSELLRLPGVGPYTAAMVAATCFLEPIPAVDTNVARVLCRVFDIVPSHFEARKSPNVWQKAGALLRTWSISPAQFNWALLDLGALICTARQPKCPACPLSKVCDFAQDATSSAS